MSGSCAWPSLPTVTEQMALWSAPIDIKTQVKGKLPETVDTGIMKSLAWRGEGVVWYSLWGSLSYRYGVREGTRKVLKFKSLSEYKVHSMRPGPESRSNHLVQYGFIPGSAITKKYFSHSKIGQAFHHPP